MQTKGGYSVHIQNPKRKDISACTRVPEVLLTSISIHSLERLLCTVILPTSCMYGLALHESQMKEGDCE